MSKDYLDSSKIGVKLNADFDLEEPLFLTKSQLISLYNVNTTYLSKYNDKDFVIDDDIVAGTYTITLVFNTGVASITVNGVTYTSNPSGGLVFAAGTEITWSATASEGYRIITTNTNFTLTANTTISPTVTVLTYTITVTVNSNISRISVTVSNSTFNAGTTEFTSSGTITKVSYGATVEWIAYAGSGYSPNPAGIQTAIITGALTIKPTATKNSTGICPYCRGLLSAADCYAKNGADSSKYPHSAGGGLLEPIG